jgi:hypothetical protein
MLTLKEVVVVMVVMVYVFMIGKRQHKVIADLTGLLSTSSPAQEELKKVSSV